MAREAAEATPRRSEEVTTNGINMGKKFRKLERRVEREYESKGYSRERAAYIGRATAGKVYREKTHACKHCGTMHTFREGGMHACHACYKRCM